MTIDNSALIFGMHKNGIKNTPCPCSRLLTVEGTNTISSNVTVPQKENSIELWQGHRRSTRRSVYQVEKLLKAKQISHSSGI